MIVIDDLADEITCASITTLLTKNRHFKSKLIISTQYINHIPPRSWMQLDIILLFKGEPEKKVLEVYNKLNLNVTYDQFQQLYDLATEEEHSFLYIDRTNNQYRIKFDRELKISN